jgi:hypothetical protein
MADVPASQQIDAIIAMYPDWRGELLARLRGIVKSADPAIIEEVKWKKPSKPEGIPTWSVNGLLCMADTLKNAVRLTFPKGAQLADPHKVFNSRLDGNAVRAIDFAQNDSVNEVALKALVVAAIKLNASK